jgi:hypothetical protein
MSGKARDELQQRIEKLVTEATACASEGLATAAMAEAGAAGTRKASSRMRHFAACYCSSGLHKGSSTCEKQNLILNHSGGTQFHLAYCYRAGWRC